MESNDVHSDTLAVVDQNATSTPSGCMIDDESQCLGTVNATNEDENASTIKSQMAKNETNKVDISRIVVICILLLASASVSAVVFMISRNAEIKAFESQYEGVAEKVLDSFNTIITNLGTINSLGVALTSHGMASELDGTDDSLDTQLRYNNTTWPFVTIPSFEQRATETRSLSSALYISFHPVVVESNRDEWETYTVGRNKRWISSGINYQDAMGLGGFEFNPPPMNEVLMTNYTRMPIFTYDEKMNMKAESGSGPFLPKWQSNPVLKKDLVNQDLYKHPIKGVHAQRCIESGHAVLGCFESSPAGSIRHVNVTTALLATLRSFVEKKEVEYLGALFATLYLPIFNSFGSDRKVVGVLKAIIHWRAYLRRIVAENINGVVVVLQNSCDGYFSYEINGEEADVLGLGDQHDARFDSYQRNVSFDSEQAILDGTENGTSMDLSGCVYTLHVYPSKKMISTFKSNTPILLTIVMVMVFAFTLITFFIYNAFVEKRQDVVLSKAAVSTAIVSSLFPKQVRNRLLQGTADNGAQDPSEEGVSSRQLSTLPIADFVPECTVLFADIAGFTAWSSSRTPEDVFLLLETVYQGFDAAAKRRQVFKVETIGDCYLAVTGLPNPQPTHAQIMARFAVDCMELMMSLTKDLEAQLGPDCSDLRMRIGMHSGSVTAGVLRGERARFQLFGDTVNTASRMESTGKAELIQISNATADILIAAGKEHWVSLREDLVEAKGKGSMQTYWLNFDVMRKRNYCMTSLTNAVR